MNATVLVDTATAPREQWLAMRRIGSSDAATICGLNPYKTPRRLYLELRGEVAQDQENEAMRWGTLLEPVIAAEFAARTGSAITHNTKMFAAPNGWQTATPDYLGDDGEWLLEIKNTGVYAARQWAEGPPDVAHIQVAHQLAVTGLKYAYVAGLVGGNRLVWHRLERDEALIETVTLKEAEFWALLQAGNPPPLCAADSDLMNEIYPQSTDGMTTLPGEAGDIAADYIEAKRRMDEWNKIADECAAKLKSLLGESAGARAGRFNISWKTITRNGLDTKALAEAHPDICAQFGKVTPYRSFSVKEARGA
jgi:putative phage-type endonuclease